jgi:hypothetical protein
MRKRQSLQLCDRERRDNQSIRHQSLTKTKELYNEKPKVHFRKSQVSSLLLDSDRDSVFQSELLWLNSARRYLIVTTLLSKDRRLKLCSLNCFLWKECTFSSRKTKIFEKAFGLLCRIAANLPHITQRPKLETQVRGYTIKDLLPIPRFWFYLRQVLLYQGVLYRGWRVYEPKKGHFYGIDL